MRSKDGGGRPLEVPAAYGVVVEHIRRGIHLGKYAAGEMLPPERVHAKELGVSRVTLREALRVLEGEGYIEMHRGARGGAMVQIPSQSRARLRQQMGELIAIQEFRLANERLAAERAATRITNKGIARLEATIEAIEKDSTIEGFRRADSEFHLTIADMADSVLTRRAVEEGRAAMFPQLDLVTLNVITTTAIRGHSEILEALRAHDAGLAGKRMAAHIRTTTKELREVLGEED